MMNTHQKIWTGIANMIAGQKQNDDTRFREGKKQVDVALATIPPPAVDPNLLRELHQAGMEMCEAILPEPDVKVFLSARERFQIALAKIREGK